MDFIRAVGPLAEASRRWFMIGLAACGAALASRQAGASARSDQGVLRLACASDMQFVLQELGLRFESQTGQRVQLQAGSSGNLARKISQGMAADVFFSADESYVSMLVEAGLTRDRGQRYASGRLALLVHRDQHWSVDSRLAGLDLQLGAVRRFAIANPEHAPYGRGARQALQRSGLWSRLAGKLVLGENVAHAAQFVASAAAQAGIVSLSMARLPQISAAARPLTLERDLHEPIHQRLVVLKGAPATADRFLDFLARPESRELMRRHGLDDPA